MWTESPVVRALLDRLTDGVLFVDLDGRITFWNLAAEKITGIRAEDAVGRFSRSAASHLDESGGELLERDSEKDSRTEWKTDAHLRHAEGRLIPVTISISQLHDDAGRPIGRMETFTDRSPQIAAVERLRELEEIVHTDALTGIGNRRATEQILTRKLDELDRYGWPFGVLFLDLDNFKRVNDRYGHEGGDFLLCATATGLSGGLRSSDFLGRWGGEEFVIIVSDVDHDTLSQAAERFRAIVESNEVAYQGETIAVTASIGATTARNSDTLNTLIDRADHLMYESKFGGKNRVSQDEWTPVRGADKQAV